MTGGLRKKGEKGENLQGAYINLFRLHTRSSKSESVSDPDSEKIGRVVFRPFLEGAGLSSSVGGGVSGSLPLRGTLILPFGFLAPLTRAPLIGGFLVGLEGA